MTLTGKKSCDLAPLSVPIVTGLGKGMLVTGGGGGGDAEYGKDCSTLWLHSFEKSSPC